jgi:hypothetical protein
MIAHGRGQHYGMRAAPSTPKRRSPESEPDVASRVLRPRAVELLAVYAFCLAVTVGPLGFIVAATP